MSVIDYSKHVIPAVSDANTRTAKLCIFLLRVRMMERGEAGWKSMRFDRNTTALRNDQCKRASEAERCDHDLHELYSVGTACLSRVMTV
jgi:hypothetical protein